LHRLGRKQAGKIRIGAEQFGNGRIGDQGDRLRRGLRSGCDEEDGRCEAGLLEHLVRMISTCSSPTTRRNP
jgi:hypothetical protein